MLNVEQMEIVIKQQLEDDFGDFIFSGDGDDQKADDLIAASTLRIIQHIQSKPKLTPSMTAGLAGMQAAFGIGSGPEGETASQMLHSAARNAVQVTIAELLIKSMTNQHVRMPTLLIAMVLIDEAAKCVQAANTGIRMSLKGTDAVEGDLNLTEVTEAVVDILYERLRSMAHEPDHETEEVLNALMSKKKGN